MNDHDVPEEAKRRRTFAIISHPDAGKTTLTERLLLHGHAITAAGSVRARPGRRSTTSDWMQIERDRGISIASTVLRFEHRGTVINLVDTPGHEDFSEDTYRVLTAVDAALMVIDGANGVEERTLRLFEVCRERGTPLLTFVNKCDRPCLPPLELLDRIQEAIGIAPTPVTWPIAQGREFQGVAIRHTQTVRRFDRTSAGAIAGERLVNEADLDRRDPDIAAALEEVALLDAVGADLDRPSFLEGRSTPTYFGSALMGFGVGDVLDAVVDLAPAPSPVHDTAGVPRELEAPFSGFVFKVQSNMDARHRDRVAFIRVCSGRFARGMALTRSRGNTRFLANHVHDVFGRGRSTLDEAFPGDVIGLSNARDLRLGDTVFAADPVAFPAPRAFTPELFAEARNVDPQRSKQFRSGLAFLDEEGVVQVLRHQDRGDQLPVLGAIGDLQFQIFQARMEQEFDTRVELTRLPPKVARSTDRASESILATIPRLEVLRRSSGEALALFPSTFIIDQVRREFPDLVLR
ncbi:MAG: peptide chain release factor 3 [Actinomycetota bacterium]